MGNAIVGKSNCEADANCGINGLNKIGSFTGYNPTACETQFNEECHKLAPEAPPNEILVCHETIPTGIAEYFTLCFCTGSSGIVPSPPPYGGPGAPCRTGSSDPSTWCDPGLEPVQLERVGGQACYCQNPTNPIPTSEPGPVGTITLARDIKFDPTCAVDGDAKGGINTALGCIPANSFNAFIAWLLGRVVFIASGIAFILMLFGAIMILTSAGTPEKVKAGSELITSALGGLVFIILSVFLLNLIGVNILHIPGFGK